MKSRLAIWLGIVIGGAIYHLTKHWFGFPGSVEDYFSSVYWTGAALGWHYLANSYSVRLVKQSS